MQLNREDKDAIFWGLATLTKYNKDFRPIDFLPGSI